MSTETRETERLVLRQWRVADIAPFSAINADPAVMRHFPACLTSEESSEMVARIKAHWQEHGFGLWAVETKKEPTFIGFVGLSVPRYPFSFQPCVEVGWRLACAAWGKGYATEAAREALQCGFDSLDLKEIVSFTAVQNAPSRRVMTRIGMTRTEKEDFEHPGLPTDSPLRPHVLYRISRQAWERNRNDSNVKTAG